MTTVSGPTAAYVEAAKSGTLDLLDGALYAGDPYPVYAWLRANAPAYWDAGNKLWAISRYDDVAAIERDAATFRSGDPRGGYRPQLPPDPSMIGMDDPEHTAHRRLLVPRFTPRSIARQEAEVQRVVDSLLDAVLERARAGEVIDVVDEIARPLPALMIGRLLGFPDEMWPKVADWSTRTMVAGGGPRYISEDVMLAVGEFYDACRELYDSRKASPEDDVMSVWARATIGNKEFSRDDVLHDCLLVLDGGAETTRTVLAGGFVGLADRPEEWESLATRAETEGASAYTLATEELIRWVTPILNMCRTAVRDVEVGGAVIGEGQQVALLYPSANRDETHFDRPDELDLTRDPNRHLAFGLGTHFCLGASLARLEIRLVLEGVVRRFAEVSRQPEAEPEVIPGAFVAGYATAPLRLTPR
jgi:cytochrome P450 family 142 subfamily A polypeptide 1